MDLTDKQNLQLLLKKQGLRPQKRFGQNFLIDGGLPQKLVATAQIGAQDTVLEIGPGIGAITQALAQKAKQVVAIEKDREMVNILRDTLDGFKNVKVIQGDVLRIPFSELQLPASYQVVGNLPFYLTAPVIRMFLEVFEVRPRTMTLVVQKEVAQRICAKPPKMSILANSVQFYADPEMISMISKKSFFPQPKVDATLIKITPRPVAMEDSRLFFEVVKAGFSHPRKQLLNNLAQGLEKSRTDTLAWLQKNNISPQQRAETLSVDDWINLVKSFKEISYCFFGVQLFFVFKFDAGRKWRRRTTSRRTAGSGMRQRGRQLDGLFVCVRRRLWRRNLGPKFLDILVGLFRWRRRK